MISSSISRLMDWNGYQSIQILGESFTVHNAVDVTCSNETVSIAVSTTTQHERRMTAGQEDDMVAGLCRPRKPMQDGPMS